MEHFIARSMNAPRFNKFSTGTSALVRDSWMNSFTALLSCRRRLHHHPRIQIIFEEQQQRFLVSEGWSTF
jgi:hypothetical protein